MKKSLLMLLCLMLAFNCFAQDVKSLDQEKGFYIYLKGANVEITEEEYLNYAKVLQKSTYDKYINDPFEWDEQYAKLKVKFDEAIKDADLDSTYTISTNVDFTDYDFTNAGYKVEIGEGVFFPLGEFYYGYKSSSDSLFQKEVAFSLHDLHKYNFFAMEKEEAKTFLQGRKDRYGDINKGIMLVINYKIANYSSDEYKAFANLALNNNYLPVVGIIQNIEVYDTSNKKNIKKLGDLIQK